MPSKASYKFLVLVLPLKFTKVVTNYSGLILMRKSLVMTDLPTPVSPIKRQFLPYFIRVCKRYLYFTVSFVGTRMSKNSTAGLYSQGGIYSLQFFIVWVSVSIPYS